VAAIARSLVVLHATDPSTVYLSVAARTVGARPDDVERSLYDERTLIRMLGMRRTMFVVPDELAAVVKASSTDTIAVRERRKLVGRLVAAGVDAGATVDVEEWLDEVADAVHDVLCERGELTAAALTKAEPRLQTQVDPAPGKAYSRPGNITSWVLALLAAEGRAVRGRPRGSWTSSQYAWSPIEHWLPRGMPALAAEAARAELAERWLHAFGPARVDDLTWWTGWTRGDVRRALDHLDVAEVDLDDGSGVVLADDVAPTAEASGPWAALLPALDPTPMGWADRDWFLEGLGPQLFDRTGNIGPTVWWNGRVVGAWAQRNDGEVVTRILADDRDARGKAAALAIAEEAQRLGEWLGEVRVTPRFRTPVERELAGPT
jgi:hypothetical protein